MDFSPFFSLSLFLLLLLSSPHSSSLPTDPDQRNTEDSFIRLKRTGIGGHSGFHPSRVTQISWQPRAFLHENFLSDEECDHLINLAKDELEESTVADDESGESVKSDVRTSSGMFLDKNQDEVVESIEARVAAWTFLPQENAESMQILHYENGQKYEPHYDYFVDKANQELGGHRVATVLMYLSNVDKGGETIFPHSEAKENQPKDDTWSECAKSGYAVKPRKGDALLFFSLHPNLTTDSSSLHGSCPVIVGEKWSATKWIHVRSFDTPVRPSSDECVDENASCPEWAASDVHIGGNYFVPIRFDGDSPLPNVINGWDTRINTSYALEWIDKILEKNSRQKVIDVDVVNVVTHGALKTLDIDDYVVEL